MAKIEIIHNEIEKAIVIMKEVATWGRDRGYRVWLDEWLTKEELITKDVDPDNFCIGRMEGQDACAFILQTRDEVYWPDGKELEAVYLHKFCVRREYANMGMTNMVIEAIKNECRKKGIKYIRLDTGLDEKVVGKIYLDAGFKIVKIIDYDNGKSMALYEMNVE